MTGHESCARAVCDELRDYRPDGGRGTYCSAECRRISGLVYDPVERGSWSWLDARAG